MTANTNIEKLTANTANTAAARAAARAIERAAEVLRIKRVFDESAETVGAAFEVLSAYPALSAARDHLANAGSLYLIGSETLAGVKDISKCSEHVVCEVLAEVEIYRAAIAAADAVEAEEIRAEDVPSEFFRVLEKIDFVTPDDENPERCLSDAAQARQWLYEGHLMGYGCAFDRDGEAVASYVQLPGGVRFERCFGPYVVTYHGDAARVEHGFVGQIAGEFLDSIEELETL